MAKDVHVDTPLVLDDLYAAFEAADNIVLKKYIAKLSNAPCIEMSDDIKTIEIGDNISMYRVAKIVYDKNENTRDKLTTVYSTIFSLVNYGLSMLISGHKDRVELLVGVISRNMIAQRSEYGEITSLAAIDKDLIDSGKVLRNAFLGNFPGTELKPVNPITTKSSKGKRDIIIDAFKDARYVSAVSSIPAIRNSNESKNQEFIQGLEKYIETLKGKEYSTLISLIFSADDIDDHDLFDENVIIDLSRVGSTETKSLIMGILILRLQEHRIACADRCNSDLRHVTVLEEAHNLLKRTSTEQSSETANLLGKSVEMLANSIAEMRTYGEGFIIADQSPGLLDMSVIRNTNTKIIMRLPDFYDRELVGKAAGLNDDQIVELSKLPCGVAAIYQNDWIAPVLCSVQKPALKECAFSDPTPYPETLEPNLLFDLLDSKFRSKLDDLSVEEAFRSSIIKSSVATNVKIKLLDYLSVKKSAAGLKLLASMIFDHFTNAKEALEKSAEELTVEELKIAIMAELEPSIMQYEDEQVNLLITLIIKEYTERYFVDYPIWREFANCVARGAII